MSREIDERIVAMYFDNKNFESGAQQTLKTLDQLKQSCNMEGVGKGLEVFEDLSKKMNIDDLRRKTDKARSAFETLGNAAKKVFKAMLSPIEKVKSELDTLNGYIAKVFGIDMASKIVGSLESAFRSLTIAPVSAGWNQYMNTMDSVKTIMSSTGESIETVKGKLGEMTEYANKTIYSLNDMTSNLGKFTNNGVKLEDATNAMIGLANATADAGQGASQASMAMYNVSQAIGVGKMTTIDWKSLENANIATKKLKQTFIDAAVAHGTLEKKVEKDKETGEELIKYYTKAEKGSKAMEVSVENFRETLNKGWLDKTSMMNTFAIFSGQLTADEIAALGFSKEESARLYQIGQEAMKAATEVRTFQKMMDALKESVQSGWATSFEYIFGDMEEGTNLWTQINDRIDGILSKSTENRNNILLSWRGLMKDEDGQIRKIRDVYANRKEALMRDYDSGRISAERYAQKLTELEETLGDKSLWVDYREIAIETFNSIFDVITDISGAVKGAWTDVFGEFNADTLKGMTSGLRDFVDGIKKWLGTADDTNSRLNKIRKGFSGVFTVLKIGLNVLRGTLEAAWSFVKPLIDPLLNLFAKFADFIQLKDVKNFGDMIAKLGEKFKGLWDKLTKLGWKGAFSKVGNWISETWQSIKASIRTWMYDNNLGGIYEWFASLKEKIASGIQVVKDWWDDPENSISNFFKGIYESVTKWFKRGTDDRGFEVYSPIEQFFYRIKTGVTTAFNTVKSWWDGSGIPDFFRGMWDGITGLFKRGHDDRGFETYSPIEQFFYRIRSGVSTAFDSVKGWWEKSGIPEFFSGIWESITGLFQTEVRKSYTFETGERREWVETRTAPIVQFFQDLYESLTKIWDTLFGENGTLARLWNGEDGNSGIKKFFDDIWQSVSGVFEGKDGEDAPIVTFFNGIVGSLESAWQAVVSWFSGDTAKSIAKFFTDAWGWLMEKLNISGGESQSSGKNNRVRYDPRNPMNMIASGSVSDVGGGSKTPKAADTLTDEEKSKIPVLSFLERLYNTLEEAWNKVIGWEGWDDIGNFFNNMWKWLTDLFDKMTAKGGGEEGQTETTEEVLEEKKSFLERIGEFVNGIIDAVIDLVREVGTSELAASVVKSIGDIFTSILNVVEVVSGWFKRVTNTIAGEGDASEQATAIDWIVPAIVAVMGVVSEVLSVKKAGSLAKIADAGGIMSNLGGQVLKLCAGILLVSMAIKYLGSMDEQTLVRGAISIAIIGTVLTVIIAAISTLTSNLANLKDAPVTSLERVAGKLISTAGMVGMLWIALDKLPNIIDKLSEAKKYSGLSGDDVMKTLIGITTTVAGIAVALTLIQKIVPKGLDIGASVRTTIAVFSSIIAAASVLMGAGGVFELFDTLEGLANGTGKGNVETNMKKFLRKAEILTGGIHQIITSLLFGNQNTAKQLQEQSEDLKTLGEVANQFDLTTITAIIRLSEMVVKLGAAGSDINITELENFKKGVSLLGQSLNEFADIVLGENSDLYHGINLLVTGGPEAQSKLENALSIVGSMASNVLQPLSTISFGDMGLGRFITWATEWTTETHNGEYKTGPENFIDAVNAIIDAAANLHDTSKINFDGLMIIQGIYDAIQLNFDNPTTDLPKFNAQPIVDSIIEAIGLKDKEIADAVHGMVQNGLNLLNTGGESYSYDISGILGPDSPLYGLFTKDGFDLSFIDSYVNSATDAITEAVNGVDIDKATKEYKNKMEGFSLNVTGIDFSSFSTDQDGDGVPDIIKNISDEWGKLRASMEGMDDFEFSVKPVLDTTDFDTQFATFQELFAGGMPVTVGAVFELGEQTLPIDDSNLLAEMREIKYELRNASSILQTTMYNVNGNLASHIDGVTSAVRNIRINTAKSTLREIDEGLYRAAVNSALTGVSTYPPTSYAVP